MALMGSGAGNGTGGGTGLTIMWRRGVERRCRETSDGRKEQSERLLFCITSAWCMDTPNKSSPPDHAMHDAP